MAKQNLNVELKFRKALKKEIELVYSLYQSVIGTKYCVWNAEYPSKDDIKRDIEVGNLFVFLIEGKLIGSVSIVLENEMDEFSFWKMKNACEIARVVIHPNFQGLGLSKILIANIIKKIKNKNYQAIHLAVVKDHIPACKTYQTLGFEIVGEAKMYNNKYYLMEKYL